MRMIQKFGGTSVQDALRLRRAGELTAKAVGDGWQTAVVVSAQGDTTDILLEKAETLTACPSLREISDVPPTPKSMPIAIKNKNAGVASDTAATISAFLV